jgi:zinc protease
VNRSLKLAATATALLLLADAAVGAQATHPNPVTRPPALGPLRSLTLPPIVSRTLPNGLTLWVVEHHELPIADMILVVRSGSEADPSDKLGLAAVTADLLDEGTRTRDALQIADQTAFLGVQLRTSSSWDASQVSLHTPTRQLDSAMALFADVILNPSVPATDLERIRKDRLTALLQLRDNGPQIADRAFPAIVFGASHPYGRPASGTEETIKSITREDVLGFHAAHYRPSNATLIVVGDVKPDDIERRVRRMFAGWEDKPVAKTNFPQPLAARRTTVYLIDKPGAAQSSFRIGSVGVARSTEDYFPLLVMNTMLGGSFTSRLNQNLRETKGYTYGARSGFSMRRERGPFTASAEIVSAKSDSALLEFMKELNAIRDTIPEDELAKVKKYLQLQLPGDFESTTDIAFQLVPLAIHGLPRDYYNTYSRRIDAVNRADVQRVARRYLDPRNMAVVIVGDAKTITAGLESTNVGPLERRDISGAPVVP